MHVITPGTSFGKLWVVTVISNPCRYRRRYTLFHEFAKRVRDAGAELVVVEHAFGDRPFELAGDCKDYYAVRVRGGDELWHKENLLNLGISRIPEAEYIATVDADFLFARPDWVAETIQQLQHYPIVQMFSAVSYLGPDDEIKHASKGFVAHWRANGGDFYREGAGYSDYSPRHTGAPGGAWAYRREALDRLGGLIDTGILGSADSYMALALIGQGARSLEGRGFTPGYIRPVQQWAARADRWIRQNVGYVPGTALHYFHGAMRNRNYGNRWQILVRNQFDPTTDLTRDAQGLWQLEDDGSPRLARLRDDLRSYFRARNEDSIDL